MTGEILHVVLVRWAATSAPDVVARLDAAADVAREAIPGVLELVHGPSVSVEHLEQGYDHCLHVRFADAAARDAYLPHPAHAPLAELISTNAETFVVFDVAVGAAGAAPAGATRTPPRVVLVHGAASGPWVFDAWRPRWAGFDVRVPDLQDGGDPAVPTDLAVTTMADYARRVHDAAWNAGGTRDDAGDAPPVVLVGWSMGGLVAMMAALRRPPAALVVIEPSVPAEVGGLHPDVALEPGTYGADVYGTVAAANQSRRESLLARCERKRGIAVPALHCPTLVLSGRDYGDERSRPVARHYGATLLEYPDLGHADLATDPTVADDVVAWVRARLA